MGRLAALGAALTLAVGSSGCGRGPVSSVDVPASSSLAFDRLPDVELVDAAGQAVGPARLRGSAFALALLDRPLRFPTRAQLRGLADLAAAIAGTDLWLVSLSVDPTHDTPEELADFAAKQGIDSDTWMLWTGEEPEVYRLVQAAYRSSLVGLDEDAMAERMQRSFESGVVVVDVEGRVRGTYDLFSEDGPAAILERLRAVARE